MSVSFLEHKVALAHSEDPFTKGEAHKARMLLRRAYRLQHLSEHDRTNDMLEAERAALLWALSELGVICGRVLEERHGADLRCVRPDDHGDECDGLLQAPPRARWSA